MIKRIISIALISAAVLFTLSTAGTWIHKGEYELNSDSTYSCRLDKFGKIRIADVGAGNPVLKGRLFRLSRDEYLLSCLFDADYDEAFLNTGKFSLVKASLEDEAFSIENHRFEKVPYPKAIDKLVSFTLPKGWTANDTNTWRDSEVITERNFVKGNGYMSLSIFSYKGKGPAGEDCDVYSSAESLNGLTAITESDTEYFVGMVESDDTKNILKRCYIKKGDYVFEVSISNFDEPVTEEQIKAFDEFTASIALADIPLEG